jgi:hypothetical protein
MNQDHDQERERVNTHSITALAGRDDGISIALRIARFSFA